MREIEFRGKDLKTKQWVYGVPYTKEIFSTEHKKIIGYKTYIITYLADDLRSIERDEVDPNTIGQFTGLHDKNGVNIYEGDVVKITNYEYADGRRKYVVTMNEEYASWMGEDIKYLNHEKYHAITSLTKKIELNIEVIGNIHDKEEV